ncbi:MAG: hypothetical protein CL609_04895 [Anaerolineaceae bacterium]|nr:hypothetical protein [Anaerolineaceae bacterium]
MTSERLQEAIDFIQSEKIDEAKEILLEMVKQPFPFADSWYMLMHCMPTKRQKIWCLEECLRIKPDHSDALTMLGLLDPEHQFYSGEKFKHQKNKKTESDEEEEVSWVVVLATVGSVLVVTAAVILIFS